MSTLKKLKSIFIVETEKIQASDESSASTENNIKSDSNKSNTTSVSSSSIQSSSNLAVDNEKDDKIIDTLLAAIEKNNLGGFDYLEFRQSLKGLEKIVVDEATRYKSAFATASTMGVTMDRLVETADYYAKILDKERDHFVKAAGEL